MIRGTAFTNPVAEALTPLNEAVIVIGPAATPVASPGLASPTLSIVAAMVEVVVAGDKSGMIEVTDQFAMLVTSLDPPLLNCAVAVNCWVAVTRKEGWLGVMLIEVGVSVTALEGVELPPPQATKLHDTAIETLIPSSEILLIFILNPRLD